MRACGKISLEMKKEKEYLQCKKKKLTAKKNQKTPSL